MCITYAFEKASNKLRSRKIKILLIKTQNGKDLSSGIIRYSISVWIKHLEIIWSCFAFFFLFMHAGVVMLNVKSPRTIIHSRLQTLRVSLCSDSRQGHWWQSEVLSAYNSQVDLLSIHRTYLALSGHKQYQYGRFFFGIRQIVTSFERVFCTRIVKSEREVMLRAVVADSTFRICRKMFLKLRRLS
jgi:hypothetical protein